MRKSFFGILIVFVIVFVLVDYVQKPQDLRNRAEGCGVFDGDPCCSGMKCDINMNCDKTTMKCVKCGGDYQACCLSTDRNTCRPGLECDRGICKKKVENANGGDYNGDGVVNIADYSVWRKEFIDKEPWNKDGTFASVSVVGGVADEKGYSVWRYAFFK